MVASNALHQLMQHVDNVQAALAELQAQALRIAEEEAAPPGGPPGGEAEALRAENQALRAQLAAALVTRAKGVSAAAAAAAGARIEALREELAAARGEPPPVRREAEEEGAGGGPGAADRQGLRAPAAAEEVRPGPPDTWLPPPLLPPTPAPGERPEPPAEPCPQLPAEVPAALPGMLGAEGDDGAAGAAPALCLDLCIPHHPGRKAVAREEEVTKSEAPTSCGPTSCGSDTKGACLPSPGTRGFEMLPTWQKLFHEEMSGESRNLIMVSKVERGFALEATPLHELEPSTDSCPLIVHPLSGKRAAWDILSLFLILYDLAILPLDLFKPEPNGFTSSMVWVTRIVWTCDMVFSFFRGYLTNDGNIVLQPQKIAKHYLSTWFAVDLLIVFIDWAEALVLQDGSPLYARMGRASRTMRMVRMVRLVRLFRMRSVLYFVVEFVGSSEVLVALDIGKVVFSIIAMGHLMACLWYGIADSQRGQSPNWVESYGYADAGLATRYAISLHWSLAQFAGGMDEVTPESGNERAYAICMCLLSFIVAVFFVSNLTALMTQLNLVGSTFHQQVALLRDFLSQNGASRNLTIRAMRNAQHELREKQRHLPEDQVMILKEVSEPLRIELHFEMYGPMFHCHPFFARYMEMCPQVMSRVCHYATTVLRVSQGDTIFYGNEIPSTPMMYIVLSGSLTYRDGENRIQEVSEGSCLSEAALWTTWLHRGTLVASTPCRLMCLETRKLQDTMANFRTNSFKPTLYAKQFIEELNKRSDRELTDLQWYGQDDSDSSQAEALNESIRAAMHKDSSDGLLLKSSSRASFLRLRGRLAGRMSLRSRSSVQRMRVSVDTDLSEHT